MVRARERRPRTIPGGRASPPRCTLQRVARAQRRDGADFLLVAANRFERDGAIVEEPGTPRDRVDIEGNRREIRDSIVQDGDIRRPAGGAPRVRSLGNVIREASAESGGAGPSPPWTACRAGTGQPGHNVTIVHNALRRPMAHDGAAPHARSDPRTLNADDAGPLVDTARACLAARRGIFARVSRASSMAPSGTDVRLSNPTTGAIEAYDFKGNVLRTSRQFVRTPAALAGLVGTAAARARNRPDVDALRRAQSARSSHCPLTAIARRHGGVVQPVFNEGNLLERVDVWLARASEPAGLLAGAPSPVGVQNIDYDAKGQRLRIDYRDATSTFYGYDTSTFRLVSLYTRRDPSFTDDCENSNPPPPFIAAPDVPPANRPCGIQNLVYTYDAVGNITRVTDWSQQTLFFRNRRVEPSTTYRYDATYRLIEAAGREHLGQIAGPPIPHSHDDAPRARIPWSAADGLAMGTYIERYVYDAVGNMLEMEHRGQDPAHPGWTRRFEYLEPSLVEAGEVRRSPHPDAHGHRRRGVSSRRPRQHGSRPAPRRGPARSEPGVGLPRSLDWRRSWRRRTCATTSTTGTANGSARSGEVGRMP